MLSFDIILDVPKWLKSAVRLVAVRKSNANQIGFWGKEFQVGAKYIIVKNENLILHYVSTFKYK